MIWIGRCSVAHDDVTGTVDALPRAVLWAVAICIVGLALAIIVTVAPSSSQGEPFYVAVIAIVLLGGLQSQLSKVLHRRLPFAIGTLPEERRFAMHSLMVMVASVAVLFGTALYLTSGSTAVLHAIRSSVAVLVLPTLGLIFLKLYGKQLFDRAFDLVFGADKAPNKPGRTITFSLGMPQAHPGRVDAWPVPPARRLSADTVQRYRNNWRQMQARFDAEPAKAVREAHGLVLELAAEIGEPAMMANEGQFVASDVSSAASQLKDLASQVLDAQGTQRAVSQALEGKAADLVALTRAMAAYERMLEHLLARHTSSDGSDPLPLS
jgi:hypothetical protein